jgi:DnaJ-like protein
MKTLYEFLGVGPDASDEALKTAYRKLAKIHHPDLNPNDPDAARRFRQVAAAVAILCDAKRRAAYNQRLVRELQRRLDRERERRRLQWLRIVAVSGAAAVVTGVVVAKASILIAPVSPASVVAGAATPIVVRRPASVLTAPREMVKARSNDTVQPLAAVVLPAPTSPDDGARVSVRPEPYCQHEIAGGLSREGSEPAGLNGTSFDVEPHCATAKGRDADERGLNSNQRAALIRQAQELVASGDARTARIMMQRACRASWSRCGPNAREDL